MKHEYEPREAIASTTDLSDHLERINSLKMEASIRDAHVTALEKEVTKLQRRIETHEEDVAAKNVEILGLQQVLLYFLDIWCGLLGFGLDGFGWVWG